MGLAFALVVVIITVLSGYFFWAKTWWFPIDISTHGAAIDHQFMLTLIITGIIFVAAQFSLAYVVCKYGSRKKGSRGTSSPRNNTPQFSCSPDAAVLFIGLNLMGYKTWA